MQWKARLLMLTSTPMRCPSRLRNATSISSFSSMVRSFKEGTWITMGIRLAKALNSASPGGLEVANTSLAPDS